MLMHALTLAHIREEIFSTVIDWCSDEPVVFIHTLKLLVYVALSY
jgi:hypothetical protein